MWDMEPVSVRLRGISFLCPKYYVLSELTDLNFKMEVLCSLCGILFLKKNMNRHQLKLKIPSISISRRMTSQLVYNVHTNVEFSIPNLH